MVAEHQSKAPPTDKPPHPETSQRDHGAHVEAWVDDLEFGTFFKHKNKPRADIAHAVSRREPDKSVSGADEHGDDFRGWFARSATGFDFWSSRPRVKPRDAALLVCGYNPDRVGKLAYEAFEYLPIDTPSKRTVKDLPPAEVQSILSNFEDFKKKAGRPLSEREEHLIRMGLLDMHPSNPGPLTAVDVQSLLSKLEEVAASNPKRLSADDVEVTLEVFEAEQCRDPKLRKLAEWFAVAQAAGLKVDGMMLAHFGKAQKLTEHDHVRRLRTLRELGGSVSMFRGEVQIRGIGGLVKAEKKVGALRASEKTIRADLIRAFEEEREGPGSRDSVPAASIFPGSPRRPIG